MKREILDRALLSTVKRGFVEMPAGAGSGPVAGGGMLTQAQAAPLGGGAPMDPAAMGGAPMDPAAMGGAPMDPAAMGGAPMDPAAMGGDPAAMGGGGAIPPEILAALSQAGGEGSAPSGGSSQIVMTVPELIQLIQALQPGAKPEKGGNSGSNRGGGNSVNGGNGGDVSAKLDQVITLLSGNMMGQ